MLLYFGIDKSRRKVERLYKKCDACGAMDSIHIGIFQKYFHLYKLPCFPTGKSGATQCEKCRAQVEHEAFSPETKYEYENLKRNTPTPIWTFSGVALLIVVIASIIIGVKQNNRKNEEYILNPQVGDIYEVKLNYDEYTLYRVHAVSGDSVYVYGHVYITDQLTGLSKLKRKGDDSFIEESIGLHKSELKAKFDSGEIKNVDRK